MSTPMFGDHPHVGPHHSVTSLPFHDPTQPAPVSVMAMEVDIKPEVEEEQHQQQEETTAEQGAIEGGQQIEKAVTVSIEESPRKNFKAMDRLVFIFFCVDRLWCASNVCVISFVGSSSSPFCFFSSTFFRKCLIPIYVFVFLVVLQKCKILIR